MRDEEGGKNQKTAKATVYKWSKKDDLEEVVKEIVLAIYTIAIKEKKES